jgi:hypothetical protein
MTMTLVHPAAEDLGRFVEGTLDDAARAAVVEHIADCDECRVMVVNATAVGETDVAMTTPALTWWLSVAAAVVVFIAVGAFIWNARRDPLAPLAASYRVLKSRPIEARLSGFPYAPRSVMRGPADQTDLEHFQMEGAASGILELHGDDPKTLHAKGIANLVVGNRSEGIAQLGSAASKDSHNARYWSDLAAAQLSNQDAVHALTSADRSLALDANLAEALFNRSLAAQELHRPDAVAAYRNYLAHDSSSLWAAEARQRIELLRTEP